MARKGHTTLTLDTEILDFFSESSYNLSGTVNEFLHNFINREKKLPGAAADLKILKKELKMAESDKIDIDNRVNMLREQINDFETEKEKAELDRLKAERERQERLTSCEKCGAEISGHIRVKGKARFLCLNCASNL